jgi:hypothetical protein
VLILINPSPSNVKDDLPSSRKSSFVSESRSSKALINFRHRVIWEDFTDPEKVKNENLSGHTRIVNQCH